MNSSAYLKFGLRIEEVKSLLALCSRHPSLRRRPEKIRRDNALLRGALVLLCSHVEGFFEDIIANLIEVYDKLAVSVDDIPSELRMHQVLGPASLWETKMPEKRWKSVKAWAGHRLMQVAPVAPFSCMDADLHTGNFGNPGTEEIQTLFRTVGIIDIWDRFKIIEPDRAYKIEIDAIVNRRNQIAHGSMNSTVTIADALVYVHRAERIADIFEQIVVDEIHVRLAIDDCWSALDEYLNGCSGDIPLSTTAPDGLSPSPV